MMKPRVTIAAILLVLGSQRAVEARYVTVEGAQFPQRVTVGEQELSLHSATLLRALRLFRVYSIGLYLEDPDHAERILDDVPKRLDVEYLRSVSATQLADLSIRHLQALYPTQVLERVAEGLAAINEGYIDLEAGDRCSITYLPNRGTVLAVNGETRCVVPGSEFAKIYFSMWLGESPLDEGLRDRLLPTN